MDNITTAIVERGLAASTYTLNLNGGLSVPQDFPLAYPWNLPSRLFRFPIEIGKASAERPSRIGLLHPLLKDHPFVQHVEASLGIAADPEGAPNAYGVSKARTGLWWHAVDLISAGEWQALLATRQFTTEADIARAVTYGLTYSDHEAPQCTGYITTPQARTIMQAIEAPEPADQCGMLRFSEPRPCTPDTGATHWSINHAALEADTVAWAIIHGIEDGWFAYDRSGFLHWTAQGRERFAAGDAATFTTATGQGAFAF